MEKILAAATESSFVSHDAKPIFYRKWDSQSEERQRTIVLLHRGHEHSGRISHIVSELDIPHTMFFAWDARGNGLTEGERGFSPSFAHLVKDLDCFECAPLCIEMNVHRLGLIIHQIDNNEIPAQ